jgi:hypothetical protein
MAVNNSLATIAFTFAMTIQNYDSRRPLPPSWQSRLATAASESEVVSIAREFMAQFSPQETYLIPEACRPLKLVDASDVTTYAFLLVRSDCGGDTGTAAVLHTVASFFSGASARLAEIMATSASPQDGSRQLA